MLFSYFFVFSSVLLGGIQSSSMTGHAYHSIDGGATFTLDTVAGVYFNDFSFPSANKGFATAFNVFDQSSILVYA